MLSNIVIIKEVNYVDITISGEGKEASSELPDGQSFSGGGYPSRDSVALANTYHIA